MAQIAIIGLGNFGYYLGRDLYEKGHDVIGIDIRKEAVQRIRQEISEAVVADGTDREVLESLGIQDVDIAVVAIGTNMLASILTTFNLREIKVKEIYSKALSEEHGRILKRVGAHHIVFPEKDVALGLARRIHHPNMLDYLPFQEDYAIFEIAAPSAFHGKPLRELDLINKYGLQVIAVRNKGLQKLQFIPRASYVVQDGDGLILLGAHSGIEKLGKDYPE
ncbi:trk system potassium uptake protein TrkA [Thermodesulforhabdus norvegica]|uniref:Trk system potassium uptake protein TrkA n=2 Tax=Thermodesulforhabdus norvegica TaxID=39841 RepID=A0A1I4TQR3_9BACT|nr:trk system potassium uptake protein TrkA [Thermodesulforhabdus norvegica]